MYHPQKSNASRVLDSAIALLTLRHLRANLTASRKLMQHAETVLGCPHAINAHRIAIKRHVRYRAENVARGECIDSQKFLLEFDVKPFRSSATVARQRMIVSEFRAGGLV